MRVSQTSDRTPSDPSSHAIAWALPATYARLHADFVWQVPAAFNLAQVCCARWAAQENAINNIAIQEYDTWAGSTFYTYFQL
jgi:acetyl-CoA synthetase